ncbi:MAG: hypothetical protein ACM3S0_17650 [Acidobacteriota bacterium]
MRTKKPIPVRLRQAFGAKVVPASGMFGHRFPKLIVLTLYDDA